MECLGSGLGVPVLIHLNEHDARLIKQLVETQAQAPEQVGGDYWPRLAAKVASQIEASYERYFDSFRVVEGSA